MKILVVDDNENNLYQLRVLLSANGYQLNTAANGAEALEKGRLDPPDLVISDILMPVMDGFTLCRNWMRDESLRRIPFVFYTATYTDEKDRQFALSLGARRFILKPEEPDVFVRVIHDVIGQVEKAPPSVIPTPSAESNATSGMEDTNSNHLRKYNEVLIRKLEDKLTQLEVVRRELEDDIARRKQVEEALRDSELNYRRLYESMMDAFVATDMDGRIREFNPAFQAMLDYTDDELRRMTYHDITPETWHDIEARIVAKQILPRGYSDVYEKEYRRRNGTVLPVELRTYLNRDEMGRPQGMWAIVRDISQRKQAEKERDQLREQFIQAQKMEAIGQLAGGMAHDFNNILQVMQGYGQLLLSDLDPKSEQHEYAFEIHKSAVRAAQLTRQLLAFSRRQVLEPTTLDLNQLIGNLTKMIRRLLDENIKLHFTPRQKSVFIRADAGQLDQVLMNLCINARDAMSNGGTLTLETDTVEIDDSYLSLNPWARPGSYAVIVISDTGEGMDETIQQRAFDPFFTTKEVGKGTGLGLATVHGIINQHGGMIRLYSEPGIGTTFRLYLPRGEHEYIAPVEERGEEPVGGNETILLAEDDPAVRNLTVHILKEAGYVIIAAKDGKEALELIRDHHARIDLILSDVVMPGGSGNNIRDFFRGYRPDGRVLFMSGYSAGLIEPRYFDSRNVAFIQKPFSAAALLTMIRKQLDAPNPESPVNNPDSQ